METLKGMSGYFKQVNAKVAVVTKDEIEETGFTGKGEALFDIEPEDLIMISDPSNSLGKILNLAYVAIEEMQGIYKELGIPGKVEGYYDTSELNVPATFILTQKEARIIFKYGKRDYGDRASGTEILKTLLSLRGPKG